MASRKLLAKLILSAAISSASFCLAGCYSWFEQKVGMNIGANNGNLISMLYQESAITKLEPPQQVIASQGLYSNKNLVFWTSVNNATSYAIERAVIEPDGNGLYRMPDEGDFELLSSFVYGTLYEDIILVRPSYNDTEYQYRYFYRVSSQNIQKNIESSDFTDIKESNTQGLGYLLPAPSGLEATKGKYEDKIELKWNKISNAKYYTIYRGLNEDGTSMEVVDTVIAANDSWCDTIAPDKQGTEYYYKISAKIASGEESAQSGIALGYSLKPGAPATPAGVRIKNGDGCADATDHITIEWDAQTIPAGAGQTPYFFIYRTSSESSVFTLVKSKLEASKTNYIDNSALRAGVTYYYYVQAVVITDTTGEKIQSAFSESGPASVSPARGYLLSYPTSLDIEDSQDSNKKILKWTPAIGTEYGDNFTYSIYGCGTMDGTYGPIQTGITTAELTLSSNYYSFEIGKYNFYRIKTVNANGIESNFSEIIAPYPDAPINVYATKTEKLADSDFVPNQYQVYPVKITWEKPSTDNPNGYMVYRSTSQSTGFRKVTTSPITTLYYIDAYETAKPGTPYFYKIVSINELGQGKKGNDPAQDVMHNSMGYGALTHDQWFREYNKTVKASQKKLTLMHKPNDLDKVGSETIYGTISGSLSYKAAVAGLGAEITMHYTNYADFYFTDSDKNNIGLYFYLNGNTDTTSNMSANGHMHENVVCEGMYPGIAYYDNLQIKGGAAGGGYYEVETKDLNNNTVLPKGNVNWLVGEE